jgi:hypothetical protein
MSGESVGGIRLIDAATIGRLKAAMPLQAVNLLETITQSHEVKFVDYRDNPIKAATAYTLPLDGKFYVFLNPDEPEVADSIVHELGHICTDILGYSRDAKPRLSYTVSHTKTKEFAVMTTNAFRVAIAERNLEARYGIDRSCYKNRRSRGFETFFSKPVDIDTLRGKDIGSLTNRVHICYVYNFTRLVMEGLFSGVAQRVWDTNMPPSPTKDFAEQIYWFASKEEMTPTRYVEVQRYFIKTLRIGEYVKV